MQKKLKIEKNVEVTSSSPDDRRLQKRWGYIAALPSEFLIHFREGKLHEKTTGQGGSCFKRWNDTIFIVPTSLKEIVFEANQLTQDNVDVKIRGMALYRISDPMKIYRLINFSHRQSAEEKLARMIGDMCRSTSKWLVSNMRVEECIRKRKEDIAGSLKKETSYVVAHDKNGWGVELVTIDIQDVYIQDAEIFNAMQMLFKSEKMRESRLAEMEMARNLELKKLEQERELAEHRKETELEKANIEAELNAQRLEMGKQAEVVKLQTELELAEYRKNNELDKAQKEAEIQEQQIELSKQNEEKQFQLDKYRVEQNEEISGYKFQQQAERERRQMQVEFEKAQKKVEAQNLENQEEVRALREKINAENATSPIMLEKHFSETALPSIADAMAKSLNNVKINIIRQDGEGGVTPFHLIFSELTDLLRERLAPLQNLQPPQQNGEEPQ